MKLKGKVALITGAGQGVGQGIALAIAKEGGVIAVTGRTFEKLQTTCQLINDIDGKSFPIQCDIKDSKSIKACVEQTVEQFGTIDILINNAQEVPLGTLDEVSEENFTAGWESGPLATMRLMKACKPYLKDGGCIINLASTAAKRWNASGFGVYAAVKEAIRSLSRAAACEWAEDGIRTNVILPHATSPGLKWWIDNCPEDAEKFISTIPMKRIGDCEQDIGRFVATLCSDDCAYVNGQSIAVDGGQAYMG